ALSRRGDYAGAESAFRDALTLKPNDATARANLATVLRRQRKVTAAEVVHREALARDTAPTTARRDLADTLYEQARYAEAATAYPEAPVPTPRHAKTWRGPAPP